MTFITASKYIGNVYIQGVLDIEGNWKYEDGTEVPFFKWAENQPGTIRKKYLNLWHKDQYFYHDVSETDFSGYLCEIHIL